MSLFGQTKRHTPMMNSRQSPLPIFTPDSAKKYGLSSPGSSSTSRYWTMVYLPLPRLPIPHTSSSESLLNGNGLSSPTRAYHTPTHHRPRRYVRVYLPIPPRLYARLLRMNSPLRVLLVVLFFVGSVFFLLGFRKRGSGRTTWTPPFRDPNTLVLSQEELAMIWEWEVLSGHYPSLQQRMYSGNTPP